jgi:hypothetical protein
MNKSKQNDTHKRKLGSLRGLVKSIAPNFNEPLSDLLEYETPKNIESTALPFSGNNQRRNYHE